MQSVLKVSEPTSWELWGRDAGYLSVVKSTSGAMLVRVAGCLRVVGTYLPGSVGQRCRLYKRFWNLPPGLSGAGVQAV